MRLFLHAHADEQWSPEAAAARLGLPVAAVVGALEQLRQRGLLEMPATPPANATLAFEYFSGNASPLGGRPLLLAINWLSLALTQWSRETQHQLFIVRPLAFLLIVAAVVDKNRRAGAGSPRSKKRKSVGV